MEEFLSQRLNELGLDYDTYGPYVQPLLEESGADDAQEEWQTVLELLQASSETHSEDDAVWQEFRIDALEESKRMKLIKEQEQEEKDASKLREMEAQIENEKAKAKQHAETEEASKKTKDSAMDEATKKALLSRFEYENDEDDVDSQNGESLALADDTIKSNRDVAKEMALEKTREMRSQKVTTKKEEQEKTNQQKKNKEHLKEERRKRASKGERRR